MKKPFRYDELSDKICESRQGCRRRLKKNVVARQPTADRCYRCWMDGIASQRRPSETRTR